MPDPDRLPAFLAAFALLTLPVLLCWRLRWRASVDADRAEAAAGRVLAAEGERYAARRRVVAAPADLDLGKGI